MTDLPTLDGPRMAPANGGPARKLIVFLHGVGADGQDLIGLAPPLAQVFPDVAFASPNAPERCDMAPFGYQWFSLMDRSPAAMLAGVQATAPVLDAFLDAELERHGLAPSDLALVGFSQGTMMSLHVAPRRPEPVAGVVGFSGRLLAPELLADESRSKPPFLLIHGDADEIVPYESLGLAEHGLNAEGFSVETLTCAGLGHGIDPDGLTTAARFLHRILA